MDDIICYGHPEISKECHHWETMLKKCRGFMDHTKEFCDNRLICHGPYVACPVSPLNCPNLKDTPFMVVKSSRGFQQLALRPGFKYVFKESGYSEIIYVFGEWLNCPLLTPLRPTRTPWCVRIVSTAELSVGLLLLPAVCTQRSKVGVAENWVVLESAVINIGELPNGAPSFEWHVSFSSKWMRPHKCSKFEIS